MEDKIKELQEENDKLKLEVLAQNDELFVSKLALDRIYQILEPAIAVNIKKTQKIVTPAIVKMYRENLLVLRAIEQEIKDCRDKTFLKKRK